MMKIKNKKSKDVWEDVKNLNEYISVKKVSHMLHIYNVSLLMDS